MDALFDITMLGLLGCMIWGAVALVRRTRQRQAAWESGLTAQGRVVRAWATARVVNNVPQRTQWHEYDFTTHDGRAVRFKEAGGPRDRSVGDAVLVYYAPNRPDKATVTEPGPGKAMAGTVFWLVVLGGCAIYLVHEWVTLSRY